jgi:NAD(P)-dependent dehydrogenase (short-subunit alcohol dehydrogenase family)
VTGASRAAGIGAAIAARLASDGFDVAATHWMAYDGAVHGEDSSEDVRRLGEVLRGRGVATCAVDADLSDPATPARVFDEVEAALGPVSALIASHCHDVESSILDTTVESFDLHANVNARATWLLIREFATRFVGTLRAAGGSSASRPITPPATCHMAPARERSIASPSPRHANSRAAASQRTPSIRDRPTPGG